MYKIPPTIKGILHRLSDIAEEEGAASLSSSPNGIFTISKAETYQRYYEGMKRSVQWESIRGKLFEPDSPFYGWGSLIYHAPIVVLTHPAPENDPTLSDEKRKEIKLIRANTPARLEVHKRDYICPTVSMRLIRALQSPIVITDIPEKTLRARRNRLQELAKDPELKEQLYKLTFRPTLKGTWIGVQTYTIEKIPKQD